MAMIDLATPLFGPWVRRVDRASLRADLTAGILGALLVLPQALAFASLAGLPPEYGLYTAIVPCAVARSGPSGVRRAAKRRRRGNGTPASFPSGVPSDNPACAETVAYFASRIASTALM